MMSYIDLMRNDAEKVKKISSKSKKKSRDKGFSYASKLKKGMTALPTDISVHKGVPVKRLTSRGVWKDRMITLSSDKQALFITHTKVPTGYSSQLASTLSKRSFSLSRKSGDGEKFVRHIDVADIDGWQVGAVGVTKLELAKMPATEDVDNLLTIFYRGSKSMCFIVQNKDHLKHLVQAMEKMKARYNLMAPWIDNDQLLLRYIYYDVDKDKSGTINYSEFKDICKRINFKAPAKMEATFKQFSDNRKEISIAKTLDLLREVSVGSTTMPADVVWDDAFGKNTTEVGSKEFQKFLKEFQGEGTATKDDAKKLITSINALGNSESSKKISKADFVHFLLSKYNDAFDPSAIAEVPAGTKLDLPISQYWINTSHNTYLLGDQLKSRSSVEAYQNALNRGCKCLELDCWDGEVSKDTGVYTPVIYHGHTLTPKMTFRSACLVTKNYLDAHPDTYPIILSLENHCSLPYQKVMAETMNELFGKKLYVPTEEQFEGGKLPSPEKLRGMVIIKGKRPPEPDDGASETFTDIEDDYADGLDEEEEDLSSPKSQSSVSSKKEKKKKAKKKVDPELKKVTLLHGAHYKAMDESIAQKPTTMHSIGETKIPKLVEKSEENSSLWREYNRDHMTRTYPAGSRVDSSNYTPILAWAMGCQLVALNFQTPDSNLSLNDGLFRQAGQCGYLPKPASLMGGEKPKKTEVKITVLSARCLPKPKGAKTGELVDPYVQVDLHDVRLGANNIEEHVKVPFKTPRVNDNGFNPVWKKGATKEFKVHSRDIAMIHFRIVDDDLGKDDKIASSSIPISCLRKGYRSIQLYDLNNTRTGPFNSSILFVKIE